MEEHPQYAQTVTDIEARGYKVVPTQGVPCVVIREVVDTQGNVLRIEREVQVRFGMPYLDLEHELGHLDQIQDRLKADMLPIDRVFESGRESPDHQGLYEAWMNDISEYQNRLVEYLRLHLRGVDLDVLEYHAQEVRNWRGEYSKISREAQRGSRRAVQRMAWGQKFFPDIAALAMAYREASGDKLEQDLR